MNERQCRCNRWHTWEKTSPWCECGARVRNVTMRPRQVERKKKEDIRDNVKIHLGEMVIFRCSCHRWHSYTPRPGIYTCACGRLLTPELDLGYQEIQDTLVDEDRVSRLMAECNDMEGSCFLGRGKYD